MRVKWSCQLEKNEIKKYCEVKLIRINSIRFVIEVNLRKRSRRVFDENLKLCVFLFLREKLTKVYEIVPNVHVMCWISCIERLQPPMIHLVVDKERKCRPERTEILHNTFRFIVWVLLNILTKSSQVNWNMTNVSSVNFIT